MIPSKAARRLRLRSGAGLAVAALALGLAACSGTPEPAPTVTKTVEPSSAGQSAMPSTESAPVTSAAPSSTEPAEPVSIQWVQVDRRNESGHLATESLSVPTLKNAPEKVKKAFDARVSSQVQKTRKFLLEQQDGMLEYNDPNDPAVKDLLSQSYLKSSRAGSAVYKDRYASAIIDLDGAEGGGTHMTKVAASVTMDIQSGEEVPLTDFVGLSRSQLESLLAENLKAELTKEGMADDPFRLLQNVDSYEWMVSDKGVTFRYLSIYEGGWDYVFTLPWSELGR
ncbi:hypothetical protein [Galactobacter sp.]|uniref:hypothetical protein n=1 Tax=Galactobacter sp. TaxID=2676125 RepID=UPI0025C65FA1|nr:hypothetical protein [Galactobacter sp.]